MDIWTDGPEVEDTMKKTIIRSNVRIGERVFLLYRDCLQDGCRRYAIEETFVTDVSARHGFSSPFRAYALILCGSVRVAPPTCVNLVLAFTFPFFSIFFWFRYQSVLPQDCINFSISTGIELCKNTNMFFSIAAVNPVTVANLTLCHQHIV